MFEGATSFKGNAICNLSVMVVGVSVDVALITRSGLGVRMEL